MLASVVPFAGLIDKIMSKDKWMTYEDLCAAVLPVCLHPSIREKPVSLY